jgi:hypothetical protein
MSLRAITIPVVGAPYANKDKSNRQFEIMLCEPGDPLTLLPEPKNKYDEHAIAVFSERNVQIGYITSERAPFLLQLMRAGHDLHAIFQAQTSWGAFARIGIDEVPTLPLQRVKPSEGSDPDSGFYPDWIPPDD